MWTKYIKDYVTELDKLIQDAGNKKCYWWVLLDARILFLFKGCMMSVKLPFPRIIHYGFACRYRMKKHNEEEINRVREIWRAFIERLKEKIDAVNTGQQTIDEAFTEGILMENGEYGLKYKEEWRV